MQYKIVQTSANLMTFATSKLQEEVEKHLKEGWKLQGGVSISCTDYKAIAAQAMIK